MPGLVPGIHAFSAAKQDVDGRAGPGHDGGEGSTGRTIMRMLARTLAAAAAIAFALPAQAQNYPNKPIRLIVSIAAGSVTDVIMRAAATELQPRLGQPLVVENVGGAAGILGGKACAQAPGDGHSVCVVYHSTMSFNPLLFNNLPYNPDTDFIPLARLFFLVEGVFVSSELGVNSIAELKTLAQSKPTGLNYATLGEGSYPDLFMKWMNNQWGTKIVGIPYRGGGPAAQAVAANQVQLTRFGVGNFLGVIQAGKVKALAVSSIQRSPTLPDVPTFREVGWGDYPGQGWWGLAVPKGTPQEAVARLGSEFQKLFSEPKFIEFLHKQAVVPAATDQAGFIAFLNQDRKDAATLIKIANIPKSEFKE
jgi:tripartite-type tricarboxylate transporter receptor subunit TctC